MPIHNAKPKPAPTLSERLKAVKQPPLFLWEGPHSDGPNGGVTQSMLGKFLTCPERFRIAYVKGLRGTDRFSQRMEYGNLHHVAEEWYAKICKDGNDGAIDVALSKMEEYARGLLSRYPMQQQEIEHWFAVCQIQFPLYVKHWAAHPDMTARTPLLQEQVFDVPYRLPSGRTVRLRGKWDSVDLVTKGEGKGIWLGEHKTKGDIDEQSLQQQLTRDLQVMYYLSSLADESGRMRLPIVNSLGKRVEDQIRECKVRGVRYNVIRRPLSGGKGTITQHQATKGAKCGKCKGKGNVAWEKFGKSESPCPKCGGAGRIGAKPAETKEAFYGRVEQVIQDDPEHFFMRWNAEVSPADIARFRKETLDGILERLVEWWQWINSAKGRSDPFADGGGRGLHWIHPFGADNGIDVWGSSDLDQHIQTGSLVGLRRRERLFDELQ